MNFINTKRNVTVRDSSCVAPDDGELHVMSDRNKSC